MDILGIGFPELMLILILALMVFGPRRLPEIAGKLGKFIRDVRGMSQGLLTEWQREITVATRLEEIEAVRQELELTRQELRQTQQEIGSQTRQNIAEAKKNIEEAQKAASAPLQPAVDSTKQAVALSATESSKTPTPAQANVEVNSQVAGVEANNGRVVTLPGSDNDATSAASAQETTVAEEALNE
jgi:Tat protein translocase TatB subunit